MAIWVNSVGPLRSIEPQRRTGFEVLIDCGAAVLFQFASPAQAALSRTNLCDHIQAGARPMAQAVMVTEGPC